MTMYCSWNIAPRLFLFCFLPVILSVLPSRLALAQDSNLRGMWNGFNNHSNVIECSSGLVHERFLELQVFNNSGELIGGERFTLRPKSSQHLLLDNYNIRDAYGTYLISGVGDDEEYISCATVLYRHASLLSSRTVEYALQLPIREALQGESAGIFNSFGPVGSGVRVFNWLSLVNFSDEELWGAVEVYSLDGVLSPELSFRFGPLKPGERRDLPLGHPFGERIGLYRIVPDNGSQAYQSFLSRYGLSPQGEYVFAFSTFSLKGLSDPGPLAASTMDPATNWLEIANPTVETQFVAIEVLDSAGVRRHFEEIAIFPFAQKHVFVNAYIGDGAVGTLRVATTGGTGRILVQSAHYGRETVFGDALRWAYVAQAEGRLVRANQASFLPFNTFMGAANWAKFLPVSTSATHLEQTFYAQAGNSIRRFASFAVPGGSLDLNVHGAVGANGIGLLNTEVQEASSAVSAEILRVYPDKRGGMGYIMRLTGEQAAAQENNDEPLEVSSNPHYFQFRGKMFWPIGDSISQGWMELGTDFNQTAYLDELQRNSINTLMIWSYIAIENQSNDSRIGYHAPRLWPWIELSGNVTPPYLFQFVDLQGVPLFNELYFQRLRDLVSEANQRNIAVIITVHDGWTKARFAGHPFKRSNGGPLDTNREYVVLANPGTELPTTYNFAWGKSMQQQFFLERFSDRLIQATGDLPNVIYEILNEGEWYDTTARREFVSHFVSFFKRRTSQPLLVHGDAEDDDYHDLQQAEAVTYHTPTWSGSTTVQRSFISFYDRWFEEPTKPIIFNEPVPEYLGNPSSRDGLMRLMWGTLLGGAGFLAPNDTSWRGLSSPSDPIFRIVGGASRLFNQDGLGFENMRPSEEFSSSGASLVNPGVEYLTYAEISSSVTVDLGRLEGSARVRFFNPRTGEFFPESTIIQGGNEATEILLPFLSDWVVWVKKE